MANKRNATVWIPKTKRAMQQARRSTVKRVTFLLSKASRRVRKVPGFVDKKIAQSLRAITRRR